MSINQAIADTLYTGKDNALAMYNISKFSTGGKYCLMKVGKASENGIALQFADIASTGLVSVVSNNNKEKGIKPVEIAVGDVIHFSANCSTKKKDFKTGVEGDSPEKKVIETITKAIEYLKIELNEIVLIQCNFSDIPSNGWAKKVLKGWMDDKEQRDEDGCLHPFLMTRFSNKEALDAILTEQGMNLESWSRAYAVLDSSVFVERKEGYAKKDFGASLIERVAAIKAITPETKAEIFQLVGLSTADDATKAALMESYASKWLESI